MSTDDTPEILTRLIGQHPAALRIVCWAAEPHEPGYLEIETKHGFVTLIDHRSGAVYANPPAPPDADVRLARWQRDLTDVIPGAFTGRPRFSAIEPMGNNPESISWRFTFDTGAAFTLTPGESPSTLSRSLSIQT